MSWEPQAGVTECGLCCAWWVNDGCGAGYLCIWGCGDNAYLFLQVVLLGDHKQLRPVVKNEQLQNLGLDRSLFERYHRDAYMLDTQYRMVRPSQPLHLHPRVVWG